MRTGGDAEENERAREGERGRERARKARGLKRLLRRVLGVVVLLWKQRKGQVSSLVSDEKAKTGDRERTSRLNLMRVEGGQRRWSARELRRSAPGASRRSGT